MPERFNCPAELKPYFSESEVSIDEEDERKTVSGCIAKIKTSEPGFEGSGFGYLHLSMVCSGARWAGAKHIQVFEKIMTENNINMEDICKMCNEPRRNEAGKK